MASPTQCSWSLSKLWEMANYREAWSAATHGVTKSFTQLSNCTTTRQVGDKIIEDEIQGSENLGCQKNYLSEILKLIRIKTEVVLEREGV